MIKMIVPIIKIFNVSPWSKTIPKIKGEAAEANIPKKLIKAFIDPKLLTPYISAHNDPDTFSPTAWVNPITDIYTNNIIGPSKYIKNIKTTRKGKSK